jgi:hypothetical protein
MQKQSLFKRIQSNKIWAIALMGSIALVLSACSTAVMSSNVPTPTTVMGVNPPAADQPSNLSTEMPTEMTAALPNALASGLDVCSLVSKAEAEAVLGQNVLGITPGTDSDILPGSTINFCTYLGSDTAIILSSVDSGSANAASEMLKVQLANAQSASPDLVITEEPGLGSKAYWTIAKNAAAYTILKDTQVFSVALGGKIGDAASHKAALLDLANKILAKY